MAGTHTQRSLYTHTHCCSVRPESYRTVPRRPPAKQETRLYPQEVDVLRRAADPAGDFLLWGRWAVSEKTTWHTCPQQEMPKLRLSSLINPEVQEHSDLTAGTVATANNKTCLVPAVSVCFTLDLRGGERLCWCSLWLIKQQRLFSLSVLGKLIRLDVGPGKTIPSVSISMSVAKWSTSPKMFTVC